MDRAVAKWKDGLPSTSTSAELEAFLKKLQKSYVVYGDLVLLPAGAFTVHGPPSHISHARLDDLYGLISKELKATHIATTRPIPPTHANGNENILRAPENFTPLYGDFGPSTASSPPTVEDFEKAYWVTAKQNGIYQTWAPRWTMFSRGNISEKVRILEMPSVAQVVEERRGDGRGCAAVDLYAGIGYFAFSYLKAGVRKVLCWDLNSWSIEGLLCGARANKWKAALVKAEEEVEVALQDEDMRVFAFNEDNTLAAAKVESVRERLPPIRHVNCGLLPTSEGSWRTAIAVLDREYDGWLHVHENFAVNEINDKAEMVRRRISELSREVRRTEKNDVKQETSIEYINQLKSYAPGVMHCVIDIFLPRLRKPR